MPNPISPGWSQTQHVSVTIYLEAGLMLSEFLDGSVHLPNLDKKSNYKLYLTPNEMESKIVGIYINSTIGICEKKWSKTNLIFECKIVQ